MEAVVRRYFEIVADLGSSLEDLRAVLHPEVRVVERPNALNPRGAVRDREGVEAGFLAGKQLLSAQSIEIHDLLALDDRAAVRSTWRGTVGIDTPAFGSGTELVAYLAAFIRVEDGRVREHETFDCYEPFGLRAG